MHNMKRVFVDMDDVLCDFTSAFNNNVSSAVQYPQSKYGFFLRLEPIKDAIESYHELRKHYDVWILTRPSVLNPLCYTEKRLWVEEHLGMNVARKLIISPDKSLLMGDYLIDDQDHNFLGESIKFGSEKFPDWKTVITYLVK